MVVRLTDILTPGRVKVPLVARDKRSLIAELVDVLNAAGDLTDRDRVLTAVLQREATRTTGIGDGLALPHGKCAEVKDLTAAMGICAEPVDFDSIDGRPVELAICLVSPADRTGPHIQALARITRLMTVDALRDGLRAARSGEEACRLIAEHEVHLERQ